MYAERTIEIKLKDDDWLYLAFAAHYKNITLNAYINDLIMGYIDATQGIVRTPRINMDGPEG